MRRRTTWILAGLALLGTILVVAFATTYSSGQPIRIPSIADESAVTYSVQGLSVEYEEKLVIHGVRPRGIGPFEELQPCVRIEFVARGDYPTGHCLGLETGDLFDYSPPGQIRGDGFSARATMIDHHASFYQLHFFTIFILQGHEIQAGQRFTLETNGAKVSFQVEQASAEKISIVARRTEFQHVGPPTAWNKETTVYRYTYAPLVQDFPTEVETYGSQGWAPMWKMKSTVSKGHDLPSIPLVGSVGCLDCKYHGFDGRPRAGKLSTPWEMEAAWSFALSDSRFGNFWNGGENVVLAQAHFRPGSERDVILGPIGVDVPTIIWEFVLLDPDAGDAMRIEVKKRTGSEPVVANLSKESTSYSISRSVWPSRLVTAETGWSRIAAIVDGATLERVSLNERLDDDFFGRGPYGEHSYLKIKDPATREGMPPDLLYWTFVVGFADGGAETFDMSASNGQWLTIPNRYAEAFGVQFDALG